MDGNGRWARERGLPRYAGHREGVQRVKEIVRSARELGVEVLTLYAFSSENWSRPQREVSVLMRYLGAFLKSQMNHSFQSFHYYHSIQMIHLILNFQMFRSFPNCHSSQTNH